jgi:hypothetical protein
MHFPGAQLPTSLLAIHAAEMEQGMRCPEWRRADRIERNVVLDETRSRPIVRLGSLLLKMGQRLQQADTPRALPLEKVLEGR